MSAYRDTLAFLYAQLPMYQRVGPMAFNKGLGNTRALLKALGNPHKAYPCIHIAGTNGKGTVAHMLAACLTAAGFKTGLCVSPHYKDFRERMKIDGALIPKAEVVEITGLMLPVFDQVRPSFFEMTVAMAFRVFQEHHVDIAVVETGLGGRLDSTNVINPVMSVITNISFDHMAMLGNTLPAIAREKAGIIKPGVPVVIGEYQSEVAHVFKGTARRRHAPISFASRSLKAEVVKTAAERRVYYVSSPKGISRYGHLRVKGIGPHQSRNLVTALHAMDILAEVAPGFALKESAIRKGLMSMRELAGYQGRWQILGRKPLVLCDSGHNIGGLKITLDYLNNQEFDKQHFVLGFVNDKDLDPLLSLFPHDAKYYFCRPDISRGLDAVELQAIADLYGLRGRAYSNVRGALRAARRQAHKNDCVFVGGSTFVVAEIL